MALGSTQPLVKMSTRNIAGGKGGRCVRVTAYHHTVPQLPRTLWDVMPIYYLNYCEIILTHFIPETSV